MSHSLGSKQHYDTSTLKYEASYSRFRWDRCQAHCSDTSRCLHPGSPVMWCPWSYGTKGGRRQTAASSLWQESKHQHIPGAEASYAAHFLLDFRGDSFIKMSATSHDDALLFCEASYHVLRLQFAKNVVVSFKNTAQPLVINKLSTIYHQKAPSKWQGFMGRWCI